MKFLKILSNFVFLTQVSCKIIGPPKTFIPTSYATASKVRTRGSSSTFPSCSGSRSDIIGNSEKICNTVRECKQVCNKEECKTKYEYRKVQ